MVTDTVVCPIKALITVVKSFMAEATGCNSMHSKQMGNWWRKLRIKIKSEEWSLKRSTLNDWVSKRNELFKVLVNTH